MKNPLVFLTGILFLFLVSGCVSEKSFNEMSQRFDEERAKNEALVKEISVLKALKGLSGMDTAAFKAREKELLAKINQQAKQIKSLKKGGTREVIKEVVKLKTPDMSWAQGVSGSIGRAFKDEIRKGSVQTETTEDRFNITLLEPLLFEPDGVLITVGGEEILARLGEVLKKIPNRPVSVGAHLDNRPIALVMAGEFPTAWDFTAARAVEVVRFLEEEGKISGKVLSGVAYGAARPVASNSSPAGQAKNRRIVISLLG